jgi:hypothetical protein
MHILILIRYHNFFHYNFNTICSLRWKIHIYIINIGFSNLGRLIYEIFNVLPNTKMYLFNPNSTGRVQCWPCLLWQNSFLTDFLKFTYSCRNVLEIFLIFWRDIKKWRFDIHFDVFSSQVLSQRYHSDLPASDWFYCYYRPPKHGRSPAGLWSAVRWATFL